MPPEFGVRVQKRVLFMINSMTGGGAERVLSTILGRSESLRRLASVELALLDRGPQAYLVPDWVRVHQLNCRKRTLTSLIEARRLVKRVEPDLTFSFLTRANVAAAVANAGRTAPWIVSERVHTSSHLGGGLRSAPAKALIRIAYPRAHRVVAVSDGIKEDLVANFGVDPSRIDVFPNPVDIESIQRQAGEAPEVAIEGPYVLGVGRLVRQKNFALLVRAFAASGLDGRLVILGEGPEREALVRLAAEVGIGDRVLLPGFVRNPFALMARARIFALPSNAEGFPNGLVEAMASGAPVISTDCNSGPSQILAERPRGEVTGVSMAPHGVMTPVDDVNAMAEALRRMADPAIAAGYRERGRLRAGDFGVDECCRRYLDLAAAALGGAPVGEPGPAQSASRSGGVT